MILPLPPPQPPHTHTPARYRDSKFARNPKFELHFYSCEQKRGGGGERKGPGKNPISPPPFLSKKFSASLLFTTWEGSKNVIVWLVHAKTQVSDFEHGNRTRPPPQPHITVTDLCWEIKQPGSADVASGRGGNENFHPLPPAPVSLQPPPPPPCKVNLHLMPPRGRGERKPNFSGGGHLKKFSVLA